MNADGAGDVQNCATWGFQRVFVCHQCPWKLWVTKREELCHGRGRGIEAYRPRHIFRKIRSHGDPPWQVHSHPTTCPSRNSPPPLRYTPSSRGRLAQLVRAPALQAGCRGFKSLTAHHTPFQRLTRFHVLPGNIRQALKPRKRLSPLVCVGAALRSMLYNVRVLGSPAKFKWRTVGPLQRPRVATLLLRRRELDTQHGIRH